MRAIAHCLSPARRALMISILAAASLMPLTTGCAQYTTPAAGISMASLAGADEEIAERMRREPAAPFPARVAVVRVQAPNYRSYTNEGYGRGKYSVVTTRDIEQEDDFARLTRLPMLTAVAALNRLVLPADLRTDKELRVGAASVKADLLLVYSVDTTFRVDEAEIGPLGIITLGTLPTQKANVSATVSAALFDVRTGYVYGLLETTAKEEQLGSAWTRHAAIDAARQRAESAAFRKMVAEFEPLWKSVVEQYASRQAPAPAPIAE